jgi:RimJ/RimL family protein N-acetyltransferase
MARKCEFCEIKGDIQLVTQDSQQYSVCDACYRLAPFDNSDVERMWVRPMQRSDLELVLAWRSNPDIYRFFREQSSPLTWADHRDWFETKPDNRDDFVIRYCDRRIGVVSLDAEDFVSIYLGETSLWGNGLASKALTWLCDRYSGKGNPIRAEIHQDNKNSQNLFQTCGFERTGTDGEWLVYTFCPDQQF